jgi:hypothetical protein
MTIFNMSEEPLEAVEPFIEDSYYYIKITSK